jgi:hypothetical protein
MFLRLEYNINITFNYYFLGSANRNCTFRMFIIVIIIIIIIIITYSLHVSAPTGRLQVEYIYWLLPKELFGERVRVWFGDWQTWLVSEVRNVFFLIGLIVKRIQH